MSKILFAIWFVSPFVLGVAKLVGLAAMPWMMVATVWAWGPLVVYAAYFCAVFNA